MAEMSSELIDDSDRIDYRFEIVRLHSFMKSVLTAKCAQKYAKNGFYYTDKDDKVKCFECGIIISGVENKDPREEHERNYKCRFIREIAFCGNVPIGVDPATIPRRVPKMEEICKLNESYLNLDCEIDVYFEDVDVQKRIKIGDVIGATYPDFAYYESRLNSYLLWPVNGHPKKEDMAAAGFVCTNYEDKVYCFHCGIEMKDWKPHDDPIQKHNRRFPDCKFIKRLLAERRS